MTTKSAPTQTLRLVSNNGFAEVWKNETTDQQSLHATASFAPGDVICAFHAGTVSAVVTYLTVQVDDDKHITLQPEFLQYINHSCSPTVFFDTTLMQLVCLAEINPGGGVDAIGEVAVEVGIEIPLHDLIFEIGRAHV